MSMSLSLPTMDYVLYFFAPISFGVLFFGRRDLRHRPRLSVQRQRGGGHCDGSHENWWS
jgi:hypothetical protein